MQTKCLGQLEAIAKDGRKYFGGDKPSAVDFHLLGICQSLWTNPNIKDEAIKKVQTENFEKHANVKRIMDTLRGENGLDDYIKELHAKGWPI